MRLVFPLRLAAALVVAAPMAASLQAQAPITVFVVRHAEKGPENPDPSLTPEGKLRSEQLAEMLKDAGIGAVFVSQFKRTQETAAPLAARLGLTPTVMDARDVAGLVDRLKGLPAGSSALVVSHSNLVPAVVNGLTGAAVGELTDQDYDRIYLATVPASGPGQALLLHFGKPAGR